jgi:hypothetical protein
MDRNLRVLIYPSGSENALEVKEALSNVVNIEIYGASSKYDHSEFVYKRFIKAPNVTDENFIDIFNSILLKEKIDIVIPTHDTVALELKRLESKLSAMVLSSSYETTLVCRSKRRIYDIFKSYDFCPTIYDLQSRINYPCYLKPDIGEGGKFSLIIKNKLELDFYLEYYADKDPLLVEYLPNEEFTVDCFTDKDRNLRYVGARKRNRVFSGISVNSSSFYDERINSIAGIINQVLEFNGYWFFQLKKDINNEYKLLEVSVRPAGTMVLYRQRGINFILLSIYNLLNYKTDIIDNGFDIELDRCFLNRYKINIEYNTIYSDFDDTIICNNRVNKKLLCLLFQAKEQGKDIILISKHNGKIKDSLKEYCIDPRLFTQIILLTQDEEKCNFIKHESGIFIDNSFSERKKVRDICSIPVFDVNSIDCLLDWKA